MDGTWQTFIELWFNGVNIAVNFARQGLGQRLRDEEGEEEREEFEFEPCSRVKVESVIDMTISCAHLACSAGRITETTVPPSRSEFRRVCATITQC
jgi:hypothetical protein